MAKRLTSPMEKIMGYRNQRRARVRLRDAERARNYKAKTFGPCGNATEDAEKCEGILFLMSSGAVACPRCGVRE